MQTDAPTQDATKGQLPNWVIGLLGLFVFLLLFLCGEVAIAVGIPNASADTRSIIAADYGIWAVNLVRRRKPFHPGCYS